MSGKLTRRDFLRITAMTAVGVVAAACAQPTEEAPAQQATRPPASQATATTAPAEAASKFKEAPMLAELVKAGTLPPVEERLPPQPLVVEPVEEVGQYGGTWRLICPDDSLGWWNMTNAVEPMLRWNRTATDFIPNLVESYAWNNATTELTVNYRKGIKWSDGEPYTAANYMFYWNDMVLDDSIPVTPPYEARSQGELMKAEQLDDYAIKFSFKAANPLFLMYQSRGYRYGAMWYNPPAHYMKQFHPKFNTTLAATDTQGLMDRHNNPQQFADRPVVWAWRCTEHRMGERSLWERNPYYWKVDPEGNQLPYIDGADIQIVREWQEIVTLKAAAGELDAQFRDFDLKDVPMLKENEEKGDFTVMMWERGDLGWPALLLGFDYPDEGIVDLMYEQKFRQAVSYAINRPRINDIVSLGMATPRQAALSSDSPEFQTPEGRKIFDEWAAAYADYEPDRAKRLLDEIGVADKNNDGWRERPDGTALELVIDVVVTDKKSVDATDFIKEDWEAIGLKTVINAIDGTLMNQRAAAGEYMFWARGSNAAWGLISATAHWCPIGSNSWALCPRCGKYYETGGAEGVQPRPGSPLEKLQNAYTEMVTITDDAERAKALLAAYRIHIDEGPLLIGVIGEHASPVVLKNNFRNVPDFGVVGPWDLSYPGTTNPEQYFFKT